MVDGLLMAHMGLAQKHVEEEQKRELELVLIQNHLEVEAHVVEQAHKLYLVILVAVPVRINRYYIQ